MSGTIPQTHFLSHCEALRELQFQDKGDTEFSAGNVAFCDKVKSGFIVCLAASSTCLNSSRYAVPTCSKTIAPSAYVFHQSLKGGGGSITLWIIALFKSLTPLFPTFLLLFNMFGSLCEFGCFLLGEL